MDEFQGSGLLENQYDSLKKGKRVVFAIAGSMPASGGARRCNYV